jgi:hypothetical protein
MVYGFLIKMILDLEELLFERMMWFFAELLLL